jgi:hypothetical protein
MRAVRVLAVVFLLLAAGCAAAPQAVPGQAAPVTATASATRTTGPPTTAPKKPSTTGTSGTPLPPVPTAYQALEMTGFGVAVRLPVPDGWRRTTGGPTGIVRTDVDLPDQPVKLRVDLTAREPGTARDAAVRNEAGLGLDGYHQLAITDVAGVGDDAVDWTFTFVRAGVPRQVVDRQIQSGPAVVAVYYSAPTQLYARYLPVWEKAVRELVIRSS